IDGVICTNTYGDYEKAEPIKYFIAQINSLYDFGHKIVLFTARANADALGPLRLLEAIRILGLEKREDGFCADAHTPPDGNP
ncbi:MAG: hypothetical protein WBE81_02180, partial [Pseudolabrys sp.]